MEYENQLRAHAVSPKAAISWVTFGCGTAYLELIDALGEARITHSIETVLPAMRLKKVEIGDPIDQIVAMPAWRTAISYENTLPCVSLAVGPPPLTGTETNGSCENTGKMALVRKAAGECCVSERHLRVAQQPFGFINPAL
jgi:hypothetical protein